jgi:phospholipid transport system substrate-binding protein
VPLLQIAPLVVAVTLAFGSPASAAAEEGAAPPALDEATLREPVERLYAALLDVMKRADALGFAGRYEALEPVVRTSYDLPFMAELIVGRQWRALTPEQQQRWLDAFARFTVSTYADRFDRFSGERFEVGYVDPGTQGTALVHTTLVRSEGEPVKLDYRLRQEDGQWRIIDVYLSGTVSELALRRSEYASLMRREGFDALLDAIRKKTAAAEAGTTEKAGAP